jgi:hypothetical protein
MLLILWILIIINIMDINYNNYYTNLHYKLLIYIIK